MNSLKKIIEIEYRKYKKSEKISKKYIIPILNEIIHGLDIGHLRVAEKLNGKWIVHYWLKKAILLFFIFNKNKMFNNRYFKFYDKIPLKFEDYNIKNFQQCGYRIVPGSIVRKGSFIGKNTVLMPSYINIGAYIDEGSMIDSWSTIGSCAQIGKNVHISGGSGIGGVLEPIQNNPTIIEDNCFIGARSEISEGVIVERNSVISTGVFISKSTKIYNRITGKIIYGYIPSRSVVISGNIIDKNKDFSIYCAVIVKQVDEKTYSKIKINSMLRNITNDYSPS